MVDSGTWASVLAVLVKGVPYYHLATPRFSETTTTMCAPWEGLVAEPAGQDSEKGTFCCGV